MFGGTNSCLEQLVCSKAQTAPLIFRRKTPLGRVT